MTREYHLNKNIIFWFSACKHEYAVAIYHQHGNIDFEIKNFRYYIFAIAVFGIHIGITIHKYYYYE